MKLLLKLSTPWLKKEGERVVETVLRRLSRRDGKKYSSGYDCREKALQRRVWGSFAGALCGSFPFAREAPVTTRPLFTVRFMLL